MKEYNIQIYRDVVSSLLEKSILDIGLKMLSDTDRELKRRHLTFNDALENPDVIHSILQKVLGNDYSLLVQLIDREMEKVPRNSAYDTFLASMNSKLVDKKVPYENSSFFKAFAKEKYN